MCIVLATVLDTAFSQPTWQSRGSEEQHWRLQYTSYKSTKFWSQHLPNSCRAMAMQRSGQDSLVTPTRLHHWNLHAWPGYHMQMDNDKNQLLSASIIQIDWLSGGRGHVKYTITDWHSLVLCPDPMHPAHARKRVTVRVRAESGHETRHSFGQTVYL